MVYTAATTYFEYSTAHRPKFFAVAIHENKKKTGCFQNMFR